MIEPILGPAPCGACRRPVFYLRWLGWSELVGNKAVGWMRHRCYRGVRCGALMPRAGVHCAKRVGHAREHRSRLALDHALLARRMVA